MDSVLDNFAPDTPEEQLRRLIAGYSQAQAPPPPAASATPTPPSAIASVALPNSTPPIGGPSIQLPSPGAPSATATRQASEEKELNRLQTTGSGVEQFQHRHPILGTIARVGDAALSSIFPTIAMNIPGTSLHHQQLVNAQQADIAGDVGNQQKEATTRYLDAEAQAKLNPTATIGKTPEELALHDLMTGGPNSTPKINPESNKPYSYIEAYAAVKQAAQDTKPNPADKIQPHINYDAGIPVSVTSPKGVFDVNDPNLPPEYKPLVDSANRAHGTHIKETTTAATAAQAATEHRLNQTESFQQQEKGREHLTKIEGDYTDAASKADLIRDAIRQAQSGNKMAASYQAMLATLGIATMEGVRRINAVELNIPTSAGSLWDEVQNKLGKWTAGEPMDASLQGDLSKLADEIQKSSYKKYTTQHSSITKRYGLQDEQPLPAPTPGTQGGGEKIATQQHIADYAKQKGISAQQATDEFTKAGYKIQ